MLLKRTAGLFRRPGTTLIVLVALAAAAAPGAGAHGGVSTAAGHEAEDAVTLTPTQERALDAHTRPEVMDRVGTQEPNETPGESVSLSERERVGVRRGGPHAP